MSNSIARPALPAATGVLLLPAIDAGVPAQFCKDRQRSRTLARFAQAAEAAGLALPQGEFPNIEQVVEAQWNQHLAARFPPGTFDGLAGAPMLGVSDEQLQIVINAESRLNAYRLRDVIEPLEAVAPGLGWFVEETLARASCHGHQIYDMGMACYLLDVFHDDLEEFSDRGYARALLLQSGEAEGPGLGEIAQATIDELREQHSFWPSDLIAAAGGHVHLLRQFGLPAGKRPRVMGARSASRWLGANPMHRFANAVDAALRLDKALTQDLARSFVWDCQQDDTECMGALCFLCWDDPRLVLEAVGHFEQNQYNGGEAVEAFARRILHLCDANDEDLQSLAAAAVAYFDRWALLAELLSHFPIWEDNDET